FNREFKQAVTIYDQVIANPNETAERIFQAMKEKRQTFKMQQKKMEVLIVDAQIIPFVEAQYLKAKAEKDTASKDTTNLDTWRTRLMNETLISARALWTESQINEGRRLVQEKMKILEPETRFDEFYFLFAKMAEEKRDFDEALENYQKINKDSSVYPRMLWASGWIYLRQKKFAAAQKQFEELKDTTPDNGEKIKALFWSAQSLKKSKKSKLAAQKFEEVEKLDPYGYYGILAHRELKLKFKPLTSMKLPSLQKIFNEVDPEKATTIQTLIDYKQRDYLEIGMRQFKDDVEKKILTKATQTTKTKNKKNAPKLASSRRDITSDSEQDLRFGLISAYSYAGLYLPLFQYMSSLPPAEKDAMLDQYPQILFPNDFYDLISSSAKKFKIDVALPLSIIRQESAFNPEARSHAEAYGLMQILPSVARQYQKKAQVSFEDPEELYIPEINVPIGCAFLSDLMKRWNQRFILAVASYNASPRAVNNWLLTRTKSDPLMFIEEIPYEETRGYVKLVMRNQIMYRRITDQKAFSFPEKFLIL
ncbi:MAG: transglycosylase SLT domain-containing protein, partial [Pseudobdellovibrionaceae bacterium]